MPTTTSHARMRVSADGIRLRTEAVPIPTNYSGFGVLVPEIDDNADITAEVGHGKFNYPHHAADIPEKDLPSRGLGELGLKVLYTFDGVADEQWYDRCESRTGARFNYETQQTHTLTNAGSIPTTISSPCWGQGRYYTTNDYATLANTVGNKWDIGNEDFTLMTVINMAATDSKMVIASKRTAAGGDGAGWEIGIDAGSSYPYITIEDASGNTATARGAAAIDTAVEKVLHFVIDISGNGQVYIDGAASGSAVNVSAVVKTMSNTRDLRIGCDGATTKGNFWTGTMYMLALFNDVRSADECLVDAVGGFVPVLDPADGDDLVVCKSGSDPAYFDLSDYVRGMQGKNIRFKTGTTAQSTTPHELDFQCVTVK